MDCSGTHSFRKSSEDMLQLAQSITTRRGVGWTSLLYLRLASVVTSPERAVSCYQTWTWFGPAHANQFFHPSGFNQVAFTISRRTGMQGASRRSWLSLSFILYVACTHITVAQVTQFFFLQQQLSGSCLSIDLERCRLLSTLIGAPVVETGRDFFCLTNNPVHLAEGHPFRALLLLPTAGLQILNALLI